MTYKVHGEKYGARAGFQYKTIFLGYEYSQGRYQFDRSFPEPRPYGSYGMYHHGPMAGVTSETDKIEAWFSYFPDARIEFGSAGKQRGKGWGIGVGWFYLHPLHLFAEYISLKYRFVGFNQEEVEQSSADSRESNRMDVTALYVGGSFQLDFFK